LQGLKETVRDRLVFVRAKSLAHIEIVPSTVVKLVLMTVLATQLDACTTTDVLGLLMTTGALCIEVFHLFKGSMS
jgi:hypothetical protein